MINGQLYCTEAEVIADLGLQGRDNQLLARIRAASRFINRRFGEFIPITDTKNFHKDVSSFSLFVPPLLGITSVTNNAVTVTGYDKYPLNKHWDNGPYTRIEADSFVWDEVAIIGKWGKYDLSEAIGETVTQLLAATTIAVANGSHVSPGMVLLIESEQELVTGVSTASAATSLLAEAVDEAEEEINVDNGVEFFVGEVIQLGTEDCYIKAIRTNTLVVVRGWNGTLKQTHADDGAIAVYRTYTVSRGVNGTTATAHTTQAASRYFVPEDVNWLCREITGLMIRKAQSGFSGRIGNETTGETAYYNEFPSQIKEIARNYRITQL